MRWQIAQVNGKKCQKYFLILYLWFCSYIRAKNDRVFSEEKGFFLRDTGKENCFRRESTSRSLRVRRSLPLHSDFYADNITKPDRERAD